MNVILMILAFLMLTGIALLFYHFADMNIMEGMFLAAAAVVIILHITATLNILFLGMLLLRIFGFVGLILFAAGLFMWRPRNKHRAEESSSKGFYAYAALAVIFLISIALYLGDYIQHIDELHLWAFIPKYLLGHGKLPEKALRLEQNLGTSYFHYFFQRIAGYNEGMMYVSAALLYWIGFLLPFGNIEKKEKRNVILYSMIMYLALYSVHFYGNKNLYVDIPVAAWAGGLIAWIMVNRRTYIEKKLFIILPALLVILDFKKSVGWMLDFFIILFFLMTCVYNLGAPDRHRRVNTIIRVGLTGIRAAYTFVIAVLLSIMLNEAGYDKAPGLLKGRIMEADMSQSKVLLTLSSYANDLLAKGLSMGKSSLDMPFLYFLILCAGIMFICIRVGRPDDYGRLSMNLLLTEVYIFVTATFFGFLFKASFDTATATISSQRYISIISIVLLIAVLCNMFSRKHISDNLQLYISIGLLVFFGFGINAKYLSETTSWNKTSNTSYYEMQEIKHQQSLIQEIADSDKKIYFIDQNENYQDEFAVNAARYCFGSQISDYRSEPWQFTQEGCVIALMENFSLTVDDLPALLKKGDYDYLWLYKEDPYIKTRLPELFEMEEDNLFVSGQLYKIRKGKEKLLRLELVKNMVLYDDTMTQEQAE